ncbi:tetratricopeptide repeat protein [Luteimonas sp. RIT-PG2_3]
MSPGRFCFGDIVVEEAAHLLLRAGEPQAVEPKAFAVLLALLRRPGELVGREALIDQVWGHRHVTPGVLTRAVAQLRNAMGDDSQQPRYIQTQHGVGYRFVGALLQQHARLDEVLPADVIADTEVGSGAGSTSGRPWDVGSGDRSGAAARPSPRHWTMRTWMTASLLAIGIVIATLWWQQQAAAPTGRGEASVAILPFTTLGGERDDDYFAEGLAVEMHDALAGVAGLKVAAPLSPASPASRETDVRKLGALLGVSAVLDASVRREGERLRISARLSDTRTGFTVWSQVYDRERTGVFATQTEIANEVVGALLQVLPERSEALSRKLTPTRNVVAFDAYLRGMQQLRLAASSGNVDDAIAFFNGALKEDRGFAKAQAGICRSELVRFGSRRNAESLAHARVACELARDMDPGSSIASLALGDLYRTQGDDKQALAQYALALKDPARWPGAYTGIAQIHATRGEHAQALTYFRKAMQASPGNAAIHSRLGYQQYLQGDLEGAIESYRAAVRFRPDDAVVWSTLGGLYLSIGDHRLAAEAFERSISLQPTAGVLSNYGELKFLQREYPAAVSLLRRAVELDAGDLLVWGNLGNALLAESGGADSAAATTAFGRAVEISTDYLALNPDDAVAMAATGWYMANLGMTRQAREMVARAEALGTAAGEASLLNAQTLHALGDEEDARKRLDTARRAGIPERRIAGNPFLAVSVAERRQ